MAIGEWNERVHYAVTELIFFLLATIVLFLASAASVVYKYVHHRNKVTFFFALRLLLENILPSAIAFMPATNGRVNLVFLGHQEKSRDQKGLCCKLNLVRVWVYVYFVILCGLIMMWAVSVFANSVLYRKSSSCTDLSLADTDVACFLLSNEGIPDGVKEIIDEEEGDLVPCQKVQNYIVAQNLTFDLEVVCYQYLLNPLAALGVSYGAMKAITFAILSTLSAVFTLTKCLNKRKADKLSLRPIMAIHILLILISIALVVILAIVTAVLHSLVSTRNSTYDYLRGEIFYNISVVVFASITVVYTMGLFPWWAFEPLPHPPDINGLDQEQISSTMHQLVHSMVLHHKFSGGLPGLLEVAQQALHSVESSNSLQTLTGNAAENDKEVSM